MRRKVVVTVERAFVGDADRSRHFFRSLWPESEGRAAVRVRALADASACLDKAGVLISVERRFEPGSVAP